MSEKKLFKGIQPEAMPLFEFNATEHVGAGKNCRDCAHHWRKEWRGGAGWIYCTLQPCKMTDCGFKKVKSLKHACRKFKQQENVK